jgi:hypothetical protein
MLKLICQITCVYLGCCYRPRYTVQTTSGTYVQPALRRAPNCAGSFGALRTKPTKAQARHRRACGRVDPPVKAILLEGRFYFSTCFRSHLYIPSICVPHQKSKSATQGWALRGAFSPFNPPDSGISVTHLTKIQEVRRLKGLVCRQRVLGSFATAKRELKWRVVTLRPHVACNLTKNVRNLGV